MVVLSAEAANHLAALTDHYEAKDRLEAAQNLLIAVEAAKIRIANAPAGGQPAPRPYPELEYLELKWILEHHYWISYSPGNPPVITGIFHDTADIPNRV